jgi:hypothetical protein
MKRFKKVVGNQKFTINQYFDQIVNGNTNAKISIITKVAGIV